MVDWILLSSVLVIAADWAGGNTVSANPPIEFVGETAQADCEAEAARLRGLQRGPMYDTFSNDPAPWIMVKADCVARPREADPNTASGGVPFTTR